MPTIEGTRKPTQEIQPCLSFCLQVITNSQQTKQKNRGINKSKRRILNEVKILQCSDGKLEKA